MEDFNSKYSGEEVEQLLDQVASGNAGGGGGGGITIETDPVFSASPAATITEEKITVWNGAADLVGPLDQDIAQLYSDLANKQDAITDLETIREGAAKGATAVQSKDVAGIVTEEGFVAAEDLAKVATSGSYNDLVDKPTIPSAVTESTVSGWGFTKNTGTYSKPSGGIPRSDLAEEVKGALRKAEQYTGTVTEIKVNGNNIGASGGVVDLGNLVAVDTVGDLKIIAIQGFINNNLYALPNAANGDEDDILLSRDTVKTINGESIVGSGDITITGGSGAVGPQGPQGDKGDKGDTGPQGEDGVGIASVEQTTTSSADGGSNVVTVTLTNGTTSTFTVKNGSKGSSGTNGTNGKDGANGATFTPSVDSNGNLSWTNNGGLTNPPTVNIKGPKGDKGDSGSGGGGSSSGGGKEYIVIEPPLSIDGVEAYINDIMPNTTYIVSESISLLSIGDFLVSDALSDEYNVIFKADMGGTTLKISSYDTLYWANGVIPTIEAGTVCELSIQRVSIGGGNFFNAVLTPFKPV